MEGGKLRHRVLIVEDEDNIALALDYVLTREGYDHERIANGAEALPKIRDTAPDLVLLDVMLPEVSGYEICQNVRMDPKLKDVKILMMTARGDRAAQGTGARRRRVHRQALRTQGVARGGAPASRTGGGRQCLNG